MDEIEDDSSKREDYSLLKEDPQYLHALLDKYVKVELIKDTSFDGFVHSIDPITKSMILAVPNNNTLQTMLIPGHAIVEVTELPKPDNVNPPIRKESPKISHEETSLRKKKIITWLKKNLLPVTEEDDKIVVGSVNILSPYSLSDIFAENPVIALQIKNMIEKLPDDFEP